MALGSSPHARGTLYRQKMGLDYWRFIPACAGNTWDGDGDLGDQSVHPRVRGEHLPSTNAQDVQIGSSPRARGTRSPRHSPDFSFAVHPRMRGEHVKSYVLQVSHVGSSPHARGTQEMEQEKLKNLRFIPACAGNTLPQKTYHYRHLRALQNSTNFFINYIKELQKEQFVYNLNELYLVLLFAVFLHHFPIIKKDKKSHFYPTAAGTPRSVARPRH